MNVFELADKLYEDGTNHPKKGVRKRCTPERCRRMARRAMSYRDASEAQLVEMCASEERADVADTHGYGFAWLALLFPVLQLLLQFLASRAKAHLQEDA